MNPARIALLCAVGCVGLGAAATRQLGYWKFAPIEARARLEKPTLAHASDETPPPPAHVRLAPKDLPPIGPFLQPAPMSQTGSPDLRASGPDNALAAIAKSVQAGKPNIVSLPARVATPDVQAAIAPSASLAYAATPESLRNAGDPALATPPAILVDATGVREAIDALRTGDLPRADAALAQTTNPVARAAVEWASLRLQPRLEKVAAFLAARPDWPAANGLRRRAEEVLYGDDRPSKQVLDFFKTRAPQTQQGRLALARAMRTEGRAVEANELARRVWREDTLSISLETALKKDFGEVLTKGDHKARADRLAYKEQGAASLRAATLAGPDVLSLAKARDSLADKAIAALAAELKKDPFLVYARVRKLLKDNKFADAAQTIVAAPRDPDLLVAPDEWWTVRRQLARKLLDLGDVATAYKIAAEHSAQSREARIEAEFTAGWIALRFLDDAEKSRPHFDACARLAETPLSVSRAAYWQGRAAEALGEKDAATIAYQTASSHPTTYYGQLARARLGRDDLGVRKPARVATGDDRLEAIRVAELLEALDQKDIAAPLVTELARTLDDEAQIAALAEAMARARNAGMTLAVGKLASQRGFPLDESAFPTFGVPFYEPLARSAETPMVYAIARQESAFAPKALSTAGAKGLMQMMTPTARMTAQRAGVPFDETRLIRDASFNAQLGAAHLADLMNEYRNSNILTFAAYNAGGRRVREWIAAHGDPRDPAVDPVDWIELIPIAETRNYVQRVVENLEVYRIRLGERRNLAIDQTIRQADARR